MTVAVISGHYGMSIWLGIAVTLDFGVTVGLINGYLVIRTAVPSLIVTLGSLFAVQGIVLGLTVLITQSTSVALTVEGPAKAIFGNFLFGGQLQVMVIWWLVLTAAYVFFVHLSPKGNWIFAMGGDKVSARNAGIPTDRMTILLFVLSSTSAAFVGMCQAILYNSAQVAGGQSFIFNSIISVVVGGVLLTGGFGSVVGIFFGTITFAIVNQGIYYTDFDRNSLDIQKALCDNHVPVVAHVGLIPSYITWTGWRAVGKTATEARAVWDQVKQLEAIGCFGAELEVVPDRLGAFISQNTPMIMLGMGAGPGADAQYLFAEDVLGCTDGHKPRHAKTYRTFAAEYDRLQQERVAAFKEFIADVNTGAYPQPQHNVAMQDAEFEAFQAGLGG